MKDDRRERGSGRSFEWRRALREHRVQRKLSQPEVSRRSGLSVSAIKSYEGGRRHPTREALEAIIDAIGLTREQANPLLAAAGYATNWRAIYFDAYGPRPNEWFTQEVERDEWPVFVTDESSGVIAANATFRRVMGVPLSLKLPDPEWNLLAKGSDPEYRRRLESWDDDMRFTIGLGKGQVSRLVNPERPPPFVMEAYQRFLQGDPATVTRMLQLWESAPVVEHTTRMRYPVRWRHESGVLLRFTGVMTVADVWNAYAWHDWVPVDEETVRTLAGLASG